MNLFARQINTFLIFFILVSFLFQLGSVTLQRIHQRISTDAKSCIYADISYKGKSHVKGEQKVI